MIDNKKFYFILVLALIFLSIFSFIITFISIKTITKNNIKEYKSTIILQKKEELKDRINIVLKIINTDYKNSILETKIKNFKRKEPIRIKILFNVLTAYYKKHKNSSTLKEDIKLIVKNTTYDNKKFYFWINDLTPKMIMHPILSALNNKSLKDFKDIKGKYLFNEIVELVKKQQQGFITYYWLNPKTNKIEKKLSYVKLFKPLNWVIGTGIYLKNNIESIKKEILDEIKNARFGKNGYFWVNDMNYKMIMHPIKPEYNGKIFINNPKVPAIKLAVDALKKSKKDYAFIEYKFYNPKTKQNERKLSIVKLFKPFNWVIGTGVYLSDVDITINNMIKKENEEIIKIIIYLLLINLIIVSIILFVAKHFINKYEELATKDKLTNIFNRLKIDEVLKEQFEIAKRYKKDLSVIFFDIDHFKNVNDTYGHKVGDFVLQEISNLVSKNIRKSDFFGRWGGEEFIIILPETKLNEAYQVAEKLRQIIESHNFNMVGKITCSFGVVSYKKDKDINTLIKRVDNLLYISKENGRNRVSI